MCYYSSLCTRIRSYKPATCCSGTTDPSFGWNPAWCIAPLGSRQRISHPWRALYTAVDRMVALFWLAGDSLVIQARGLLTIMPQYAVLYYPTALDAAFTRPLYPNFLPILSCTHKAHTTWLFSITFQHSLLIRYRTITPFFSIGCFMSLYFTTCSWWWFVECCYQSKGIIGGVDKNTRECSKAIWQGESISWYVLQIRGMDVCSWIVTRVMVSSYRINLMAHIFWLRLFSGRELPIKSIKYTNTPCASMSLFILV